MPEIRILIIDDHPMMREALRVAAENEPDLKVVGEAANAEDGLRLQDELRPDVTLLDVLMPGMDGVTATGRLLAAHPTARILIISSAEEEERILGAVRAGALGYFPKTAPRQHLLEAIRRVADGLPYMPAGITLKLFEALRKPPAAPEDAQITLTVRQREILALLAEGKNDEEISASLHIETGTVRSHIHHLVQRLNLENRAQAAAYAVRHYGPRPTED